jgi:hypothetical protein
MAEKKSALYTAGKIAGELGISAGKVKKLIEQEGIKPAEVQKGCSYYGADALKSLRAAAKKA